MTHLELKVITHEEERLDKWLKNQLSHLSRQTIQTLIEDGHILVNGKPLKKKEVVKFNDIIAVSIPKEKPHEIVAQKVDFSILYEDPYLLIINKPKGLVVHPGAGHKDQTLVNGLAYYLDDFEIEEGNLRPGIVHRLDKDTSGVLIVAKTKEVHFKLAELFAQRKVKKTYLAVTIGKPQALSCDLPIKRHPFKRQEMHCDLQGKQASTEFECLAIQSEYCLIKASPITGRTHQIRVHLKHLKAPIFADPIYGYQKKEENGYTLMLHAYEIAFEHPIEETFLTFKAPLPEQMATFIEKKLKKDFTL